MSNETLKNNGKNKSAKYSSDSETDEPAIKKRESSSCKRSSNKDSKDRPHRDHHKSHKDDRHDKSSSSSHRHSSKSHKDNKRDRDSHHHSDRHRYHKSNRKHRSRSLSSTSSSNEERKSKDRRHREDKEKNISSNQSRNSEKKITKSEVEERTNTAVGITNDPVTQDGSLNVTEILKSIKVPPEIKYKPAEAAKYQMDQLRLKTEELTGVKVPSFYNSTAVNPLLYAEQQKKRKLLWSKAKDNGVTTTSIVGRAIVEGQDEKTSEKFRKLMGIKSTDSTSNQDKSLANELKQKQLKINEVMDKEYELARISTHTHRGQGLGFATLGFIDPNQRPTQ